MRHRVLNDERLDPLGMSQGHAKTNRAAVILHVKGIARESECFGKMIHDLGIVIERVGEFLRVRPVAMSEARIIWRDKSDTYPKAGRREAQTFVMKREVRAAGVATGASFGPASL